MVKGTENIAGGTREYRQCLRCHNIIYGPVDDGGAALRRQRRREAEGTEGTDGEYPLGCTLAAGVFLIPYFYIIYLITKDQLQSTSSWASPPLSIGDHLWIIGHTAVIGIGLPLVILAALLLILLK
jgi:hypothetical protein